MVISAGMIVLLGELARSAVVEALKAFGKKSAEVGAEEALEWIKSYVSSNSSLSATDRKNVIRLVEEDATIYEKLIAQLKPSDKRGILLVGPSGAGKTSLMNEITNRHPPELRSTVELDTRFVTLASTVVAIHDAPGHWNIAAMTINASVRKHRPRVLAIVMANGFLDPVGTGSELSYPTWDEPATSLEKFLDRARKEELHWLKMFDKHVEVPKRKVHYLVLVVNKMDHWFQDHTAVMARYTTEFQELTNSLLKKLVTPGQTCQLATVATICDPFKQVTRPELPFNRQAALDSRRVFKAFLTGLLAN